jgi:hypothetical protein
MSRKLLWGGQEHERGEEIKNSEKNSPTSSPLLILMPYFYRPNIKSIIQQLNSVLLLR